MLSEKYQDRIYVSLDIKGNSVMINGWNERSELSIDEVLATYKDSNIRGYVVTDIKNDGMLKGINIDFINKIIEKKYKSNLKIIFAGGLTNYDDLINLKKLNTNNVEGIISGKSFYEGKIDLVKAQNILDTDA